MATFNFKSYGQLLQDMIDTCTANCARIINFDDGGVARTLFEAVASRLDYFTVLLKRILKLTRLATSEGEDVDSFTEDYGMDARLSATYGRGYATFTRYAVTSTPVLIPVGASIFASDDSVEYEVIADTDNVAYDPVALGYYIPANVASVIATVQAKTAGTIGNVGANTLTVIGSTLVGVDAVTNASAINNAVDEETDEEMKERFPNYINTRARATVAALEYAIDVVQNGLTYIIAENVTLAGEEQMGHVVVVVDDGTGTPSSTLLDAIRDSLDLYRAATVDVDVYPPTLLEVDVACTVTVESGYVAADVKQDVEDAIIDYLDALPFQSFLGVTRIADIAYNVAGVKDVDSILLNGGSTDVQAEMYELIKAGTVTIS